MRYGRRAMAIVRHIDAFLLSREWRDADDGVEVVLWARAAEAPVRVRLSRQEAVMFVPRDVVTHTGRRVPRPLHDVRWSSGRRALLPLAARAGRGAHAPA